MIRFLLGWWREYKLVRVQRRIAEHRAEAKLAAEMAELHTRAAEVLREDAERLERIQQGLPEATDFGPLDAAPPAIASRFHEATR